MSPQKLQKKNAALGLAVVLSAAVLLPTAAQASPAIPTTKVNTVASINIDAAVKKVTTYKTTSGLNMRNSSSVAGKIVTVLSKNDIVTKTGKTNGNWWQIKTKAHTGWVNSNFLKASVSVTPVKPKTPTPKTVAPKATPKVQSKNSYITTGGLNMRDSSSVAGNVVTVLKKDTPVTKTGKMNGNWWQIKTKAHTGWVNSSYLKAASSVVVPQKPKTSTPDAVAPKVQSGGTYVTTGGLNVRKSSSVAGKIVTSLAKNTKVSKTGETNGHWWKIKAGSKSGWVNSNYLKPSTTKTDTKETISPQSDNIESIDGLHKNVVKVKKLMEKKFGDKINSIGGYRKGSVGHSSGVAIDVMVKNYKLRSGQVAGDKMAKYLTDNHKSLKIDYLIWADEIWLGPNTGWVPYSKSGRYGTQFSNNWNDTTKHLDHIHVEVKK